MVLHVGIFVAIFPVILAIRDWATKEGFSVDRFDGFGRQWAMHRSVWNLLPLWQRIALGLLMAYVFVNFTTGFFTGMGTPEFDPLTTRMFSGHWLLFYAFSALFARRLLKIQHDESLSYEA